MDNPILQQALALIDPANEQVPILGNIRKFNRETFGQQPYANPDLPADQRIMAAINAYSQAFMGAHGSPSSKFGNALRNARPAWANNNVLQNTPPQLAVNPQKPNQMLDLRPQTDMTKSLDLQEVVGNARKLVRSEPKVANAGLYDTGSIDDFLSKKLGGNSELYDKTLGSRVISTGKDNIRYTIKEADGEIKLFKILADKKGTGVGTEFMNGLKEYADSTGKPIKIMNPTNEKFWSKFPYLSKSGGRDLKYDPRVAQHPTGISQAQPTKGGKK